MKKGLKCFCVILLVIMLSLSVGCETDTDNSITESSETQEIVYITDTGEKYHKSTCFHLRYSRYAIGLEEALDRGYNSCKHCY